MIRYKEIAFVAYPVTDVARARKFYEGVLGLKPNAALASETPHWIEYDIGSGTLGIASSPQRWDFSPSSSRSGFGEPTTDNRLRHLLSSRSPA